MRQSQHVNQGIASEKATVSATDSFLLKGILPVSILPVWNPTLAILYLYSLKKGIQFNADSGIAKAFSSVKHGLASGIV